MAIRHIVEIAVILAVVLASEGKSLDAVKAREARSALRGMSGGWQSKLFLLAKSLDLLPKGDPEDQPFNMPIEEVATIEGRGTVARGKIRSGVIKVGDEVSIVGIKETTTTTCTGLEIDGKVLDEGEDSAGGRVGVLLRDTKPDEVVRGQVLAKPGSMTAHTKFEAGVYMLTKDEGGRDTPISEAYRPKFFFRTIEVEGAIELPESVDMVQPGDDVMMIVTLTTPIAMEIPQMFMIVEAGRTVGAGIVAKIVE
ncbi:elongation factor Tu 2-like [Branchiostoma floridae]|uniref:Elongation factor Tu 2-like n=1 Tax=Branchiostoma floridae TaxID=7739 RepID=A0A9J7LSU3_BRAFL|nr:elongation factor Tu 2-like [Branchiostoma floridae]